MKSPLEHGPAGGEHQSMSFLRSVIPPPVYDLLPIALVILAAYFLLPPLLSKLRNSGLLDELVSRLGGDKLNEIRFQRQIRKLIKNGDLVSAAELYEDVYSDYPVEMMRRGTNMDV